MKVVESFPFFNELDLLEVHLHTMSPLVDKFIITEARESHAGKKKPLYLTENLSRFEDFRSKMIVQVVDSFPSHVRLFEADWFQREQAKEVIDDLLQDEDYLIYGDVDEIPRPSAITRALRQLETNPSYEVAHLAQDLFYYYFNLKETSGTLLSFMGEYPGVKDTKWLGTTVNKWMFAKDSKLTDLRRPERKNVGVRIPYGGWHFSWVGGLEGHTPEDRVGQKLDNTAHQEFKTTRNLKKLSKRLQRGQDLINRRGSKFKKIDDLSFLPEYILCNIEKYEASILR